MANSKEIKSHINSIRDIQKITNAMYLISSTKMRKAKNELDSARPYFNALKVEIKRIFRTVSNIESKYFYPENVNETLDGTYGCLVVTADKGLAGAYNQNVIKKTEELLAKHNDTKLFVVGECGRQYFLHHGVPIEHSFLYTAQNPSMDRAREICSLLLERFDKGELDKIYIVYTDWKNGTTGEAISSRLLPFHRQQFVTDTQEKAVSMPFEFIPDAGTVLDSVMQSYISGFIYSALIDSFCCEQNSRMTAMNSANKNAEKILTSLSLEYNRTRQAAITQEITEVSAGSRAMKRKKEAE